MLKNLPRFLSKGVSIVFAIVLCASGVQTSVAQTQFEDALVSVGNIGFTVTNAGFFGRANVRNNPTGPPSMEFPLDSGIEHLFESGLWIGATRSDGTETVRTGAITVSNGYRPGATGYEFAQNTSIFAESTLPTSEVFTRFATSHIDYITAFEDTSSVLPSTSIQMPDVAGQLGASVKMTSLAWNFPFAESFVIVNFDITNISSERWDSVFVGLYHDIVTRNINTTNDAGGAFFNKGGYGFIDSLSLSYGFNAGGIEETINTYGAIAFLGAEWIDPATGNTRFFHPNQAENFIADGYAPPQVVPRWWLFGGGTSDTGRPINDGDRYRRMATNFPDPSQFESEAEFLTSKDAWYERLKTDGTRSIGNWLGLTASGPYASVGPGETLQVTFAVVAAPKPEEFQGQPGKAVDTEETRRILAANALWARRTYAGEDTNFNGVLDPGEDVNNNGVVDRYLIPEPPSSPKMRVEFERDQDSGDPVVALYWDLTSEESRDPVTGLKDFEGYRIYRSNPGDDLTGDILNRAVLVAQYDKPQNRTGFNNGFDEVVLQEPVIFADDTTKYWYRFEARDLKSGWQYLFTVSAFDEGDPDAGLESFESSRVSNATRVFAGTPAATAEEKLSVGVYPNPYRVNAAWDGSTSRTRKLNFYNLPGRSEIRIYTLAGEIVAEMSHQSDTYIGDTRWYDDFSAPNRIQPGGEHSWDLLSQNGLSISAGLYLFSVKDLDSGDVQHGKFVIIK